MGVVSPGQSKVGVVSPCESKVGVVTPGQSKVGWSIESGRGLRKQAWFAQGQSIVWSLKVGVVFKEGLISSSSIESGRGL